VDRHYVPAIRKGGWDEEIQLLAPGDPIPSLEAGILGLLLTGGDDIHPSCWDPAEPVHPAAEPDPERDALEIPLARRAWELGLPILGICRGEQLLNVALGGSLIQDIPSHYLCEPARHQVGSSTLPPQLAHRVTVDPASRLQGLVGSQEVEVNSRHHQAVARLAPGLRAVAWHGATEKDGQPLVEAVEAQDASRWVVAVQWHPENLVALDHPAAAAALGLFRGFAQALRARA
jgi:putative glutamine amidotransferase